MGQIEAGQMQWYAVRVKRKQVGGIRTTTVGGDFEAYRDRQGRVRKRRIKDTGKRVFVPEHILRRAGFEVFLPIKKILKRKNRFTPDQHLVAQPLLADWVFVGWPIFESRWHELMALDVVTMVMGTGGRPIIISERRMIKLMRQWGGGQLSARAHRYVKTGCAFAAGELVRVIDGPFEHHEVRVADVAGSSVKVLVDLFGRDFETEMQSGWLEAIDVKPLEIVKGG